MDTSYYRNFVTLVRVGNMTQAAEQLHLTQPALSKQLKYLESQFGSPLLIITRDGNNSRFHLTESGRIFYDKACSICHIEDQTYLEVQRLNAGISEVLRISCAASRSTSLIHKILDDFSVEYPLVRYEIREGMTKDVCLDVLTGVVDLGLCSTRLLDTNKFDVVHEEEEFFYAVFRNDFDTVTHLGNVVGWNDIRHLPLSLCGSSAIMLSQCFGQTMPPTDARCVTTTKTSALEWAKAGLTVAVIPADEKEIIRNKSLRRVRLGDLPKHFSKTFIKAKQHPLSPIADTFLRFYRSTYGA